MRKIIVFRPGALGDTILTLPALAVLHHAFPNCHLTFIGNSSALSLIPCGLADRTISADDSRVGELFTRPETPSRELLELFGNADLILLWLSRPEEAAVNFRLLGARHVITAPPKPPPDGQEHAADYLLRTVLACLPPAARARANFGPDLAGAGVPLALTREDLAFGRAFLHSHCRQAKIIAIHPGSGGRWKCWPAERFAGLAEALCNLGFGIVAVAGPADDETIARFKTAAGKALTATAEGLSLHHLAGVLTCCAGFIGNDSGVSHLAAALGVPTLAIYGPTDPAVWGVRGQRVAIVSGAALERISVDAVLEAVSELLRSSLSPCRHPLLGLTPEKQSDKLSPQEAANR